MRKNYLIIFLIVIGFCFYNINVKADDGVIEVVNEQEELVNNSPSDEIQEELVNNSPSDEIQEENNENDLPKEEDIKEKDDVEEIIDDTNDVEENKEDNNETNIPQNIIDNNVEENKETNIPQSIIDNNVEENISDLNEDLESNNNEELENNDNLDTFASNTLNDDTILDDNTNEETIIPTETDNVVVTNNSYKVGFTYDGYRTSILGGSHTSLSSLLNLLGINLETKNVTDVTVSNNNYIKLSHVGNDWLIESINPFSDILVLTITDINENKYIIELDDPEGEPEHEKTLTPNTTIEEGEETNDGTYKLSLSVTGEEEIDYNKSNVIVILDTSDSMHRTCTNCRNNTEVGDPLDDSSYFDITTDTTGTLYGLIDYEFRLLDIVDGKFYYNGKEYMGTRYIERVGNQRIFSAKRAIDDLALTLLAQNDINPDTIQMAIISFNRNATILKDSADAPSIYTNFDDFISQVNSLVGAQWTNWEDAFIKANSIDFGSDRNDYPTYVIFVTDGEPTAYINTSGGVTTGASSTNAGHAWNCYHEAREEAYNTVHEKNRILYTIGAYGTVESMKDLTNYVYNGYDAYSYIRNNVEQNDKYDSNYDELQGDAIGKYFNATSVEEITNAFKELTNTILAGLKDTKIVDGTTSQIKIDSNLNDGMLDVDDKSFEYFLSWKVTKIDTDTYKFTMYNKGKNRTYTVTKNNDETITIKDNSNTDTDYAGSTYKGTISENNVLRILWGNYYERLETDFYYMAPQATFDGTVTWDLSGSEMGDGFLLQGVKYEVTFDVWPSQATFDLIADLKNGVKEYNSLDPEIKKYLVKVSPTKPDSESEYMLLTNTEGEAKLYFTDTRPNGYVGPVDYIPPENVPTGVAELLFITKKWKGRDREDVTLVITRDDIDWLPIKLDDNSKGSAYISVGVMTEHEDDIVLKTTGHDYGFNEIGENAYHWEIKSKVIRPMLINSKLKMLVLTDADNIQSDGYTIIKITKLKDEEYVSEYKVCKGKCDYTDDSSEVTIKYYNVENIDEEEANVEVINESRSNLDIIKIVTGYAPDESFTFKMKITSAPSLNEDDKYIWFSVINEDLNGNINLIKVITSANEELNENNNSTGYYYVISGEDFTVEMKNGYHLRLMNLLTGTMFDIEEILNNNYNLVISTDNIDLDYYDDNPCKISGIINETQTNYQITYTNNYQYTKVKIIKVWDDNNNQDGIRPESIKVILSNGNEYILNDENNWCMEVSDLPRYENNEEIVYTWEEEMPEGYELSNMSVLDNSTTITNMHIPEKTSVKVTKVWADDDNESGLRPASITITLLANGKEYDSVILSESNDWKHTFTNLPAYDDGEKIEYSVVEENVENYEVSYEGDMETGFIIHNVLGQGDYEPPEPPEPPYNNPQTGDNISIYLITLLISMIGFIYGIRYLNESRNYS